MNELCITRATSAAGSGLQSSSSRSNLTSAGLTNTFTGIVVKKPRKHEQRLLRNVGVHTVVLDLLQVPYDRKGDRRMDGLMELAHEFLQSFCLGNPQNQHLLHAHLDLFLNPEVYIYMILTKLFIIALSINSKKKLFNKSLCYFGGKTRI